MGRPRITPDIIEEELGANPFVAALKIQTTKKVTPVVNKFGNDDVKEFELESTPYTKVFQVKNELMPFELLPLRSKELYLFIIHKIPQTKDYLWIDRVKYMSGMKIKSVNTFKEAVSRLALGGYVAKHDLIQDLLWINPQYFFKGSRINKFKDNVYVKAKIEVK